MREISEMKILSGVNLGSTVSAAQACEARSRRGKCKQALRCEGSASGPAYSLAWARCTIAHQAAAQHAAPKSLV
jgi:hypothetical protein